MCKWSTQDANDELRHESSELVYQAATYFHLTVFVFVFNCVCFLCEAYIGALKKHNLAPLYTEHCRLNGENDNEFYLDPEMYHLINKQRLDLNIISRRWAICFVFSTPTVIKQYSYEQPNVQQLPCDATLKCHDTNLCWFYR